MVDFDGLFHGLYRSGGFVRDWSYRDHFSNRWAGLGGSVCDTSS
jgi:hypothetical protein